MNLQDAVKKGADLINVAKVKRDWRNLNFTVMDLPFH